MELKIVRSREEMVKSGVGKTGEHFEFNYTSENGYKPYNVACSIFKEIKQGVREHIANVVVYSMNENVEITIQKHVANKYALITEAEDQARLILDEYEAPPTGEHNTVQ